jgi:hypothetical protein
MKKLIAPLMAAALTAAAFAAISVAKDDGSGQGNGDAAGPAPGPPGVAFRMELSDEDRKAIEEFHSCMEDQGVDLPEPPPAPGSEGDDEDRTFERRLEPPSEEERAKMDEAFEACKDKLPEGARQFGPHPCGPPPGGPGGEGAAIPAPPPQPESQQEGTAAPAPQGASS